jgi:hypothetical protein
LRIHVQQNIWRCGQPQDFFILNQIWEYVH